jgi:hypothetical protein
MLLLVASVLLLASCGLAEVQVPISFEVDRDLKFLEPDDTERVSLPVTVAWKAGDDALEGGNRFALFLDKNPVGPRDVVRVRLCGEREKEPPVAGQNRRRCVADLGKHIWLTRDTELVLDCIKPKEGAGDRVRNRHTLSVIIVDERNQRVGQAGITRTFEIRDDDALRACSGEV